MKLQPVAILAQALCSEHNMAHNHLMPFFGGPSRIGKPQDVDEQIMGAQKLQSEPPISPPTCPPCQPRPQSDDDGTLHSKQEMFSNLQGCRDVVASWRVLMTDESPFVMDVDAYLENVIMIQTTTEINPEDVELLQKRFAVLRAMINNQSAWEDGLRGQVDQAQDQHWHQDHHWWHQQGPQGHEYEQVKQHPQGPQGHEYEQVHDGQNAPHHMGDEEFEAFLQDHATASTKRRRTDAKTESSSSTMPLQQPR